MSKSKTLGLDVQFVRVAAASIPIKVGDPHANMLTVMRAAVEAEKQGVSVLVFPELTLSGNTAEDLFQKSTLLDECQIALLGLQQFSEENSLLMVVGSPLTDEGRVYNGAVAIAQGEILGAWLKKTLSHPRHSYERRWFQPGFDFNAITIAGQLVPAGTELTVQLEDREGLIIAGMVGDPADGVESQCPSYATRGVSLVVNPAGSPALAGRASKRRRQVRAASECAHRAHIVACAGQGESTSDGAWDGDAFIFEDGVLLNENQRFATGLHITYADIDTVALRAKERHRADLATPTSGNPLLDEFSRPVPDVSTLLGSSNEWYTQRPIARFPYLPEDDADLADVFQLQVQALSARLRAIGDPKPVLGISGGLDSTHALLVCAEAMDQMGRPRSDILTFTMPGFATTKKTKTNAQKLCEALGTTFEELDIRPTAKQMLKQMGHPFGRGEDVFDVTFENVQAGLRTDFLFRIANDRHGIVVGTGDFSELVLGWCTYGVGDQMSHYSVNPGVPKTLMQHLIRWMVRTKKFGEDVNDTLQSILDTEITPELIPTRPGEQAQATQNVIGPYELQDFFAYHFLHYDLSPRDIAYRALHAWSAVDFGSWPEGIEGKARHAYLADDLIHWLAVFGKRFFTNQFKRTAVPGGPKVIEGAGLSPRGDLRLASDLSAEPWLREVDKVADEWGLDFEEPFTPVIDILDSMFD